MALNCKKIIKNTELHLKKLVINTIIGLVRCFRINPVSEGGMQFKSIYTNLSKLNQRSNRDRQYSGACDSFIYSLQVLGLC